MKTPTATKLALTLCALALATGLLWIAGSATATPTSDAPALEPGDAVPAAALAGIENAEEMASGSLPPDPCVEGCIDGYYDCLVTCAKVNCLISCETQIEICLCDGCFG